MGSAHCPCYMCSVWCVASPAYATPKILKKNNLSLKDVDVFEYHEAFAVSSCFQELGGPSVNTYQPDSSTLPGLFQETITVSLLECHIID